MNREEIKINFQKLLERINKENWPVHALEVYQGNELLHSYGDKQNKYPVYSITKSIVSLAYGIAENEGLISLQDCILNYIPGEILSKVSENQKLLFQNITIERLLTMSIKGFDFRPEGDNWTLYCLNSSIKPEKKEFHYTNCCAYLIGVALTNATGRPLDEYLQEKIFSPLEIENVEFSKSPEGYINAASGIKLTVEELAKIGHLLMNKGIYNNQQIVPEEYINRATNIQIMNKEGGYGYFIWEFMDGFSLNGKWGQKCYCLPKGNILISVLSNFEENSAVLKEEIISWFTGEN